MLENFITDEKWNLGNRDVVLQINSANNVDNDVILKKVFSFLCLSVYCYLNQPTPSRSMGFFCY